MCNFAAKLYKMKRIFLWTICTLLAVSFVQAEERSEQEMAAIACEQLNKNVTNNATRRASIANIEVLSKKESYRIYGSEATGGFVIVSSDDEFMPVLGYSQTRYDETNIPEGLQWWLEAIDQSLQWRKANSQRAEIVVSYTPTANFVTTTWGRQLLTIIRRLPRVISIV